MIPALILFGRWWRMSLFAAALGWPVLLVAVDVMNVGPELLGAAGLAIANTGVGVLIHQGVRLAIRKIRHS